MGGLKDWAKRTFTPGSVADEAYQNQLDRQNNFFGNLMNNTGGNLRIKRQQLQNALDSRPAITNPYANMTNEFANLGVATQAAEFQAEEADIALASTLDTMRATGAGAGGATALAQAALKSKRGISQSLQQQEAANQKAAAQGAADVQKAIMDGEVGRQQREDARSAQDIARLQSQIDLMQEQKFTAEQNAILADDDLD